jgi:transposase
MTQPVLGVGIDTARYGHHVSFLDQLQRPAYPSFHFKEDADGYDKLKKTLLTLAKKHPNVDIRVHLDPAGSYANNLTRFLQTLDVPKVIVSIGRPEANENYRKAIFGKKKADPVESLACARFAISEKPLPAPLLSPEMESLRRCVSTLEAIAKQKTQTVNQLHAILADTFPELAVYVSDITITGFGIQTAASLVAKIVDIGRFDSSSDLIGYFGCYPEYRDSGTDPQGKAKRRVGWCMAAQGNDLVRRNLYMAAQAAAQHNPAIKALYARQRQLGKEHGVAIGHCMTKLLRIAHSLWKKNQAFDPNHEALRQEQYEVEKKKENVVGSRKEVKPRRKGATTTLPIVHKTTAPSKRQPLNYVVLKSQLSIEDVLTDYGWKRKTERGSQLRGACPLCEHSDDRNFAANRSRQVFCCHRCGRKGNALDLLTALRKGTLHDAAWDWIDRKGLKAPVL